MERPEYESMYELEDSHWWFVGRRRLALALLDRLELRAGARVLDVGCGTGGNLQALTAYGRAIGLDISAIAVDLGRRRQLPFVQGSGLALPAPTASFDLITVFDVLYHRWITDDVTALAEFFRILRPGGWLLITDSALPILWSEHDEVYFARQRYTLNELGYKLEKVGFEQRVSSYANLLLLPIFLLVRLTMNWLPVASDIDRAGMLPLWLNRLLTLVRTLEAFWLARGGTLPIGSSIVCLARKPPGQGGTKS